MVKRCITIIWIASISCSSWGQVVINEVMYHAAENNLEYIELYNYGNQAVDISDWVLKDSLDAHEFIIPRSSKIPSNSYYAIADDGDLFQQTYRIQPQASGLSFNLANEGDSVRLFNAEGKIVDSLSYDDRSPWPQEADGLGASLERLNPLMPGNFPASWSFSKENGTPGKRNSVFTDDIPSLIYDVDHSPRIPQPRQDITVTARVLEIRNAVQYVRLRYAWNGSTSYKTVDMKDDGQNGDGAADDGLYGATVAGGSNADIFQFYIEVKNDAGVTSLLPEEGAELPYLAVVENPLTDERVSVFRVVMLPSVQQQFLARYQTDEYFPASFYDGDNAYYRIHIRHRGRSRSQNGRFKIRFPHSQLFRGKIRRLNFNGTDTATILREYLSFQVYQAAGLPNLETELVRFHINGETTRGTPYRVCIENPDAQFLQRRDFFNDDNGNLYKTTLDGTPNNKATWRYMGEDPDLYNLCYIKQNNEEEADYSDIIRFCRVLSQSDTWDDDYLDQVNSVLNTDDFLRWMAVSACVAHWDSPFTDHGHNYVLYSNPGSGQFHVLAWDLNGTFNFTSNQNDLNYRKLYTHVRSTKFPAINKILNHPVFGAQYYRYLVELMNTVFSSTEMNERIDEARDAIKTSNNSVNFLRSYVTQRTKDMSEWMNLDAGADFISKPVYQAIVGEPYTYHACAVDYLNGKGMTYELNKGPSWLSINARTGELSGIPIAEGEFDVSIKATTSKGVQVAQEFSLQITNPKPRLLMTFNEASGDPADLSDNNNDGQFRGGASRVDGRLGSAVYLDGRSGYIDIPHDESLNLTGSITVEAWIKPDSISNGNPVIVTKGDEDNFNYTLMLGYGPFSWDSMEPCFMPMRFDIENRVYYGRKEIEAQLRARNWVHIAGTYDCAKELVCVYADNRRIVESSNRALMPVNTRNLLIGLGSSRGFRGAVDDVKILPFAKQAFAAGLCLSNVDVSGISSAQDRISLSLSEYRRYPVSTGEYCIYLKNADTWIPLPSVPLGPGRTETWWLDELGLQEALSPSETVALYPIESVGNALPETIVDQVSWGDKAPGFDDPGVLAGVWLPSKSVLLSETAAASLSLKNFADNDECDADWSVNPQAIDGPLVQLQIGNGEEKITTSNVTLHLQNQSGASPTNWKVRLSNSSVFNDQWIDYKGSISWKLSDGDGLKTVYVQVRDAQGERSPVVSASVLLQRTSIDNWMRLD